ncbi:MAG TPA: peptidoglycan DD-metalloendopeptidase family protein [Thermoflexales bacterium]|mgnify:CR=1 FL=1|nr:peptidoglycan DD-metalloendopeptidase family protein [Thermoflexales bacterium]
MRFDQPVGTLSQRDTSAWAGGWIDANPIGTKYVNGATGLGAYHTGADLNCNTPTWDADAHAAVFASADGIVVFAGPKPVWVSIIVIKHVVDERVVFTRYAHVENMLVKTGDVVRRGQQIAQVGNANGAMPYHLHFDVSFANLEKSPGDWPGLDLVRLERDYVDPQAWINSHRKQEETQDMVAGKLMIDGTDGDGLNVRATGAANGVKIGWLADGEPVSVVAQQNGWSQIEFVNSTRGSTARGWVKSDWVKSVTGEAPTPTPVTPPIVKKSMLMGVNVLNDFGALREAEANGCKFVMVMDGVSEAVNFARAHPDGYAMLRRYIGSAGWGANDFIRGLGVAADMPRNLVLTLFNEADTWGSSPDQLEQRMRVEVDFVSKARALEYQGIIALGTFSMGNPQFAPNAPEFGETVALIKKYYAPLWNNGLIALDYHAYSPSMTHLNNDGDLFWYERRWEGFFRYGGLDPAKGLGVFFGECGVDEMGVGGFTQHGASSQSIAAWIRRFVEIQMRPLEIDGRQYPSPVRGGAIFSYGNNGDPRWRDGYDIRTLGAAPFKNAGVWG